MLSSGTPRPQIGCPDREPHERWDDLRAISLRRPRQERAHGAEMSFVSAATHAPTPPRDRFEGDSDVRPDCIPCVAALDGAYEPGEVHAVMHDLEMTVLGEVEPSVSANVVAQRGGLGACQVVAISAGAP
jgi:hypothetical protein